MKKTANNRSISRVIRCLLVFVVTATAVFLVAPSSTDTAYADMGPKPSVNITFQNMGDELCYGTLLSKNASAGPSSAWDGKEGHEYIDGDLGREIWEAFVEYEDSDGYYFLQIGWQCNETKGFSWTYFPPSSFKILLYYPETETFAVSGVYESYAFDSYFTVNMDGVDIGSVTTDPILVAKKSYNYTWEAVSLVCRIVITILLEIGMAWLFGFKQKKVLGIIAVTNVITQVILNAVLNIIRFYLGGLAFILFYVILEMVVLAIEAVVYALMLKRVSVAPIPKWKPLVYAFAANTLSFGAGFALAYLIPGIM